MLCHFVEDLLAPALNTLVAKVILVSFIQRQTHEQLPVSNHRFRAGKFISFRWPVADELHAFGREFVMQHTERIEEPLAVSQLIAKPIQRNNFTFKVQVVELIPDGFPVFLDFAKIPGRDTQNDTEQTTETSASIYQASIDEINVRLAKLAKE